MNPWRYVEKRYDPESGFLYFGLRYYDPSTAVWITPDPIAQEGGLNLYSYVLNNPLAYFDSLGLSPEVDSVDNLCQHEVSYDEHVRARERHIRERESIIRKVIDIIRNPRVQGGLQVAGGLTEATIGAAMTVYSGGIAAGAGWAVMAHGFDQYATGIRSMISLARLSASLRLILISSSIIPPLMTSHIVAFYNSKPEISKLPF